MANKNTAAFKAANNSLITTNGVGAISGADANAMFTDVADSFVNIKTNASDLDTAATTWDVEGYNRYTTFIAISDTTRTIAIQNAATNGEYLLYIRKDTASDLTVTITVDALTIYNINSNTLKGPSAKRYLVKVHKFNTRVFVQFVQQLDISLDATPTLGGELDANSNKIINLAAPTSANDAARLADVNAVTHPYNYTATTDPGATNDLNDTGASNGVGYEIGSKWLNTSSGEWFMAQSVADGAAVWNKISLTVDELGALALLNTVGTSQIDNQAVTNTKLANMNAYTVKGRTSGNGAPQDLNQSDLQDGFDMMIRGGNGEMSGPFWTDGQSSYYLQDGLFRVIFSAFSSQIEVNGGDFSFLSDEGAYRKKIVVDTTTQQIRLEIRVKGTDALVHSLILDSDGLRRGTAVSGSDDREVVDRAHVEGLIDWDAAETYTGSSGTETQNDATTDISGQTGTSVYNFLQFDATTSGRTSTGNKNFILLKQDTVEKFRVTTDGHVFLATGAQLFTDGTTPSGTNTAYDIVLSTNGKIGTTAFTTSFIQMGNSVVVEANSNITLTFRDNLLLNTSSDGAGDKVIAIGNANTAPSGNPVAGGIMWIDAGSGKYLGPNGNTITWAPTSPQTGYTIFTNLTTSRTCDADTVTTAELADIVGTLIEDIKTLGYIKA